MVLVELVGRVPEQVDDPRGEEGHQDQEDHHRAPASATLSRFSRDQAICRSERPSIGPVGVDGAADRRGPRGPSYGHRIGEWARTGQAVPLPAP